ncbi:MAG: DUF6159 family protein [Pseudomonadota bacterium]
MLFGSQRGDLNWAQDEAKKLFHQNGTKPKVLSSQNFSTFIAELRYAAKLIGEEKEIILFATLQWIVIATAYVMWTAILDWIPDNLWEEARRSNENNEDGSFTLINLVLLGWSFFVIVVATYPISLLNAAITTAHYLRSSGQSSTISKCITLAFSNLAQLWIFTVIDAWITVMAILDRLPKKRGRNKRTAADEVAYYAWKIGTIGMLPALVAGNNFVEAAKNSILLLREQPARSIGIRMGYSLLCWIIGIGAFFMTMLYLTASNAHDIETDRVYHFYLTAAFPIVIAIGIIAVLLRPFFLIMVASLYTDVLPQDGRSAEVRVGNKANTLNIFFFLALFTLCTMYFLGDQLGLRDWIEALASKDLANNLR